MQASYLLPLGLILLFVAIALIAIGSIASSGKADTKFAVGGVIGFIPFGFANDRRMLWFAMIFTAALFVFFVLIRFIRG